MPRTEARLKVATWQNPTFTGLPCDAQWLYFVLLSQGDVSLAGVVSYVPKRWARLADDVTPPRIEAAVEALAAAGLVQVDHDTDELWIVPFIADDGVLASIKTRQAMWTAVGAIHSPTLVDAVVRQVGPDLVEEARTRCWLPDLPTPTPPEDGVSDTPSGVAGEGYPIGDGVGDALARADSLSPSLSPSNAREAPAPVVPVQARAYQHATAGALP